MAIEAADNLVAHGTPKQRDRVARILKSARQAFAENAFHKVLMDDVARRAGVGKGTIYRYFPDKESLYFAVIFDGLGSLQRSIRSCLKVEEDQEAQIRELVHTLVSFFSRNGFFFQLMNVEDTQVEGGNSPNRRRWHQERAKLIGAIAEMLGHVRVTGSERVFYPRTEAQILLGMVRSLLIYNEDKLTVEQMSDEIVQIYLYGIGRQGNGIT